jgi:hypothetical protein
VRSMGAPQSGHGLSFLRMSPQQCRRRLGQLGPVAAVAE